jgi:ferredoxin
MKVSVDKDLCIGSGNCEATCPEVFEVRDDKAHVKVDTVPENQEGKVQEAIDGCPSGAITKS